MTSAAKIGGPLPTAGGEDCPATGTTSAAQGRDMGYIGNATGATHYDHSKGLNNMKSAATPSLPRRSYQVEPFYGRSDGSKTWAVRELLVTPHGYFLRRIVSFHKTFTEADRQREKMTLREREGSWGESYEEAMLDA